MLEADPGYEFPKVLDDHRINNFEYQARDADSHQTPRAAHIRKVYPRDEEPPGLEEANRHRILRRGIPYGSEFIQGEPAYEAGGNLQDPKQDRGLLVLCYQSSIARGFEFIQQSWADTADFPQSGDGEDPVSAQADGLPFSLPPTAHLALTSWMRLTGGEYFFCPAKSQVAALAQPS